MAPHLTAIGPARVPGVRVAGPLAAICDTLWPLVRDCLSNRMLKKSSMTFFNHDWSEVNSAQSHNSNELALVEIGDPSLDRYQGVEKRVFQHPANAAA